MALDPTTTTLVPAVIIAVGGILKLTFDALSRKDEIFVKHLDAQEVRQEKFLSDHMSTNVKVLEGLVKAVDDMRKDNAAHLYTLHEDNVKIRADILVSNSKKASELKKAADVVAEDLRAADANKEEGQ